MRKIYIGFALALFCSFYSLSALAQKVFIFDPNGPKWYAYQDGELVGGGRASGGKHYCPDVRRACRTPSGTFRIYHKGGPGCVSSAYPVDKRKPRAKMPYCSFFHGNYAVHGSNSVPGYNASHGCIRVPTSDAQWLSHNFLTIGTTVVVKPYNSRPQQFKKRKARATRYYYSDDMAW